MVNKKTKQTNRIFDINGIPSSNLTVCYGPFIDYLPVIERVAFHSNLQNHQVVSQTVTKDHKHPQTTTFPLQTIHWPRSKSRT